jgi:4-amino-4-deoxy-L-arabinose transferase-like glycosyltransferase
MIKRLLRNPFIIFLPFLCYYAYVVKQNKWPTLYGDEIRYMDFAKNLCHGFYSPPAPHINLWNGPGYPIILMPFVALHIPAIYITLMNALYLYLTVIFLYKAIKLLSTTSIALVCSLLFAIYPNALAMLPILYTEAFTGLLVVLFVYTLALFYVKGNKAYSIVSGLILGFLILTKIIFGYVVVICLAVSLVLLLFKKIRADNLRSVKILAIAFAVSIPYLVYTWHLTGKVFYWGDSGGMSLYWMSTPYDGEYGDWKVPALTNNQYPSLKLPEVVAMLHKNHANEIKAILKHNEVEQDELFKQAAISNIKKNPRKFIRNYWDNCSRMLFNFPYSYAYQDDAIIRNILVGSLILWASVFGIVVTLLNWRAVVFPVKLLLLLTLVYLVLSGALSAYPRQLDVVMPILLFWLSYLIGQIKRAELRFIIKKTYPVI